MTKIVIKEDWNKLREQFVRSHLRRASILWPASRIARESARTERRRNEATGRLAWHARCAICQVEFVEGTLRMDHVQPVVPVDRDYSVAAYSEQTLGALITRMLPEPDGYQPLCDPCHARKTAEEQEQRTINRRAFKARKEMK